MNNSQNLDKVFDALANEHRREIIHALGSRPWSISELASLRGLSLPAIHRHIKTLEEADMVARKKIGRTNLLAIRRQPLRGLQDWVRQFHPYWGDDKESLENYADHLSKQQANTEEQE